MRRIWFFYEWLLDRRLAIPDAKSGSYCDVVRPERQWAIKGTNSARHRVRNNLPGTPAFCPMVFRTSTLEAFVAVRWDQRASAMLGLLSAAIVTHTAAFLLFKDSQSSFAIEGEAPSQHRIHRWGKAIGEAGKKTQYRCITATTANHHRR